jgi:hypothetical protein
MAVEDTANLDDPSKIKAEYWADGPGRSSRPATGRCSPRPSPASAATASTTT